jgi:hypothetical protein
MKFIFITFMFVSLALVFMVEKNFAKQNLEKPSLMDVIQRILVDPEFLALEAEEQLRLLIIIYNILNSEYNQRSMKKKYIDA